MVAITDPSLTLRMTGRELGRRGWPLRMTGRTVRMTGRTVRMTGSGGAKIGERDEVGVVSILKQQQKFLFFIKI